MKLRVRHLFAFPILALLVAAGCSTGLPGVEPVRVTAPTPGPSPYGWDLPRGAMLGNGAVPAEQEEEGEQGEQDEQGRREGTRPEQWQQPGAPGSDASLPAAGPAMAAAPPAGPVAPGGRAFGVGGRWLGPQPVNVVYNADTGVYEERDAYEVYDPYGVDERELSPLRRVRVPPYYKGRGQGGSEWLRYQGQSDYLSPHQPVRTTRLPPQQKVGLGWSSGGFPSGRFDALNSRSGRR